MTSRPPLQAVIFDVDGTLVDSNDLHIEAWRVAFGRYDKTLTYAQVHAQIGKGGDQLMPVFLTPEELDRFGEAMEHFRTELFVRDYLPRAEPFPGVRELFERISADGMRIVLATSAGKAELEQHVKKLNVGDLIDGATSADDAKHSKPCPDIFEAALELAGCGPEAAVVVGDTPYDVRAAARAGVRTIAVLSGGFSEDGLRGEGAAAIYRDVAHLLERYEDSLLGGGALVSAR